MWIRIIVLLGLEETFGVIKSHQLDLVCPVTWTQSFVTPIYKCGLQTSAAGVRKQSLSLYYASSLVVFSHHQEQLSQLPSTVRAEAVTQPCCCGWQVAPRSCCACA